MREAKLTINLMESEFSKATVKYLGHIVGQGQVRPLDAKIQTIAKFPIPTSWKELARFLGMAGYYRNFCLNFSVNDKTKSDSFPIPRIADCIDQLAMPNLSARLIC